MINVEQRGPVTVITIDRPHARNAVDGPTAKALDAAIEAFEMNDDANVAVLTGADGTFCAGADLKALNTNQANRVEVLPADEIVDSHGPMGPTRRLTTKPVIAAIEGFAVAGGLELALWCDLRVAADDAVFGVFCRRWGVPLIDGGTIRLPRLIGHSRALDMILTGREVGADEALSMGLANRVCPAGEALEMAIALAEDLASLPQNCMRSDRTSSYEQWGSDLGTALSFEATIGMATLRTGESYDGAARFAAGAGRHGAAEEAGPGGTAPQSKRAGRHGAAE